jgi:hypothetical protein
LESSLSNCSNLKDFPESTYAAIGGLEFNDNPVICGGVYKQECFSWQDSTWQVYEPLIGKRGFTSFCPSPFPKESHKLLVAGGYDGSGQFFICSNIVLVETSFKNTIYTCI